MRGFSLLAAQIRAARALLDWSQAYLAQGTGISRTTLANIEAGKSEPHEATLFVLMTELKAAGIDFTSQGVEARTWPLRPYVPTGIAQMKKTK